MKNGLSTLADETRRAIGRSGHDVTDILWIGGTGRDDAENLLGSEVPNVIPMGEGGVLIDADEFWAVADKTVYDDGYGVTEIPLDIVIMFSDGTWLERREYDGSEWWAWRSISKPVKQMKLATLKDRSGNGGAYSIESLQRMGRVDGAE